MRSQITVVMEEGAGAVVQTLLDVPTPANRLQKGWIATCPRRAAAGEGEVGPEAQGGEALSEKREARLVVTMAEGEIERTEAEIEKEDSLLSMDDLGRRRRSWIGRWRNTGVRRKLKAETERMRLPRRLSRTTAILK